MKTKILGVLAVGLLVGPATGQAAITFSLDTLTDLQGTFSFQGSTFEVVEPDTFALLPDDGSNLNLFQFLGGFRDDEGQLFFSTGFEGDLDDPAFIGAWAGSASVFAALSGSYSNSLDGTPVNWRFFNFADTGGEDGTFSGEFCFSTDEHTCAAPAPVPLPAAAWLMLSGLAGLGLLRKRKA